MAEYLKYWPMAVVAAGVIGSASVDSFRLSAHAEELLDLGESVDENEEAIEQIQRLLIRRQGEVELQVQRIEAEQQDQGDDLDQILLLLKELQRRD